jgi:hypothetical protein
MKGRGRAAKWAWLLLAYLCLALGLIGVVLPGLPTTPFILVAASLVVSSPAVRPNGARLATRGRSQPAGQMERISGHGRLRGRSDMGGTQVLDGGDRHRDHGRRLALALVSA